MTRARLEYALRLAVHRLGLVGGLGLALAVGALLFHITTALPAQEELTGLEARLARIEKSAASSAAAPSAGAPSVDSFRDFFPGFQSAHSWLGSIYGVAEREGLELLQGTYNVSDDPLLGLTHYRILLPVRGRYPQVRRFVAGVLDEVPAVSLEHIVFQRSRIGEASIEARITLMLHLQSGSSGVLRVGAQ